MSVVICAYNEARFIGGLLASLKRQSLVPGEVIVVDDGSIDSTAEIARAHGAKVLRSTHVGPAAGRNLGVDTASGEVVIFADGDMTCGPDYVRDLSEPILAGRAVGTFTAELYVGEPANRWSRAYCDIRRLGYPRMLPPDFPATWENFRAIGRVAFQEVGGYDDVGYGEDMTLAPKLGVMAIRVEGAACWHHNPDSPKEIFENGRWIGRGHDIKRVARPWRDNSPLKSLIRSLADVRGGSAWSTILARQCYSAGVLTGLIGRRLGIAGHAK
ncbi:MAG: glycosyltransferase family 2 protein [Solirubrobacterales bacterium]|nr:glycosyltransferase family 2 protein [Solirubrobacterales bacterium]